jgi:hypothetical protein
MVSEAVLVAIIAGGCGVLTGIVGKSRYDRERSARTDHTGPAVEKVIARRADLEFQTKVTFLLESLTAAIEKGHDRSIGQLALVSEAITESADSVRELHRQIVAHRETVGPSVKAALETHAMVHDLHRSRHS